MKKIIINLSTVAAMVMTLISVHSCDIHEFPEEYVPPTTSVTMHLVFNSELPLYKVISYPTKENTITTNVTEAFDTRYIVQVFRCSKTDDYSRIADTTLVFTKEGMSSLNYDIKLDMTDGCYKFLAWTDYVKAGSKDDLYYDTKDFSDIHLIHEKDYVGNTDVRDAFRGEQTATILYDSAIGRQDVTVAMERPLAKFQFISTDYQDFVTKIIKMKEQEAKKTNSETDGVITKDDGTKTIDINDYYIIFSYSGYMPCSFNNFINKPGDAWTGISFKSEMRQLSEEEVEMGFDYVFVNGSESSVSISLAVYSTEGEKLAGINPVDVPIVRSKLTVVRGEFLTTAASGGVGISPGFDGEWNYPVI